MKKVEAGLAQITADIETEIENLKKKAREAKGKSLAPIISDDAIEKLMEEVDKEMTNAFIAMGLQEKLEALKMELSESPDTPDEKLSPPLKEKVDRLMQEFKHNLSHPGSYMALKQKLEMLSEASRMKEQRMKGEKLKKEINEKLQDQAKGKMEILRKAWEKAAKGEKLDENQIEEVEKAKEELKEMLKSVSLEVVGPGKKIVPTTTRGLEEILTMADVMKKGIEAAIGKAGLRGKVDELEAEIASGASKEKVESLLKEIREGIAAVMDATDLKKKKIERTMGSPVQETVGASSS